MRLFKLSDSRYIDLDDVYDVQFNKPKGDADASAAFRFKAKRSEITVFGADTDRIRAEIDAIATSNADVSLVERAIDAITDHRGDSSDHKCQDDFHVAAVYYTNHSGHTSWRRVHPLGAPYFGTSPFHPKPQWLIDVWDMDKGARRTYAMDGIQSWAKFDATAEDVADAMEKEADDNQGASDAARP